MKNFQGEPARRALLALAAALLPLAPVAANEASYNVTHQMTIQPDAGFGGEWQAGWRYVVGQVTATYDGAKNHPDSLKGQIEPFTGPGSPKSLSASIGASSAFGQSGATVNFTSGALPFSGSINVNGNASTNPSPGHSGSAFASSQSTLVAGLFRTSSSGHISWRSVTSVRAGACTAPCVSGRDPISFDLIDPTSGAALAGNLLAIDLAILKGDGEMNWEDGVLSIASTQLISGTFTIDQSSPFVTNPGTVEMTFENNIVTRSLATGIYAGMAPKVGQSAIGHFRFGEQDLGYDFGFGNVPVSINFGFGNSGDAAVAAVPEPSAWVLLMFGASIAAWAGRARRPTSPLHHKH